MHESWSLIQLQNLPGSVHLLPWYPASQLQVLFTAQMPFSHGGSHTLSIQVLQECTVHELKYKSVLNLKTGKKQKMEVLLCIGVTAGGGGMAPPHF